MAEEDDDKPFCVEIAKLGRAACKKCKEKCLKGELRIAKITASPFGDGKMKNWHHIDCLFEQFLKQRATTKRLQSTDELGGWEEISKDNQKIIADKFEESEKLIAQKYKLDYVPGKFIQSPKKKIVVSDSKIDKSSESKDNLFKKFRLLVANITNVSSYTEKTSLVENWFKKGGDGDGFHGDLVMWCRLLLPGVVKRIYNLQSKQLIKLFSRIFEMDLDDMVEDLEKGDVSQTIQDFYEKSDEFKPASKSLITVNDVDEFLEELSKMTREDDQARHFKKFAKKCTSNDLKVIIRLIKHDLRMNAGAKHILEGVHPDAYTSYQSSRDLKSVIEGCMSGKSNKSITLLTPVLPMLAEPCKTITQAFKKCPNGIYSEIKYDGERVQVHKKGTEFRYYSRSLKPVMQHKIKHFKDFIPQAFPHGKDLILDSEILMVDTNTGKPLPFGTLGKHKREGLDDAAVCLFVFDCIYYNGEDLTGKPLIERKRILRDNMTEIKNHIVFSEMKEIYDPKVLAKMITNVLKLGLEGLVLKDVESIYEPGKRHWLKVKKDYLFEGAMADSADLIVLGAWYGTGKKGGIMSVFLMGVHDPKRNKYCTVTKVHTGHDDKTLDKLQKELDMIKISSDVNRVPDWLKCTKTMTPDFVARDPTKQPIWEITGAEFTQQHDVHTANGISIRFPRVTKIRHDKDYKTATNLEELDALYKTSKDNFDGSLFDKEIENMLIKLPKKRSRKFDDNEVAKKKPKIVDIIDPLPDIFKKIKLYSVGHFEDLIRIFRAYGGIIVDDNNVELASHVLHETDAIDNSSASKFSKRSLHVTSDWLKDSILSKCLMHHGPYLVSTS